MSEEEDDGVDEVRARGSFFLFFIPSMSEEEDDGVDEGKGVSGFVLRPLFSLKEQIEKDKVPPPP